MAMGLNVGEHISAEVADWSREEPDMYWDPGRRLLRSIRRYQYWRNKRGIIPKILRRLVVIRYRFWSVVGGAEIDLLSQIGGGLKLPHPNGVVIHSQAKIGVNCVIHQQVTLGVANPQWPEPPVLELPVIEGHVTIYAGAKILGAVRIGAHATIGANSVVLSDVPEGATVIGVPARRVS
jgi:serine O-acetyltransferase